MQEEQKRLASEQAKRDEERLRELEKIACQVIKLTMQKQLMRKFES